MDGGGCQCLNYYKLLILGFKVAKHFEPEEHVYLAKKNTNCNTNVLGDKQTCNDISYQRPNDESPHVLSPVYKWIIPRIGTDVNQEIITKR